MNATIKLNNGVEMPLAGIGTFMLSPDEAEASCISALASGYRLIDTANAYVNERAVERAMKKSCLKREEIFLETKLWSAFYEQADAVEKTLERLDTDYIDLLLMTYSLVGEAVHECFFRPAHPWMECPCTADSSSLLLLGLCSDEPAPGSSFIGA